MNDPARARERYVPLLYRVVAVDAVVLIAAVVVTIIVLAPHKFGSLAIDEAVVLVVSLAAVVVLNTVLMRRVVKPVSDLTALARRVDLLSPERVPVTHPATEAGELARTFNEMLDRLELERRDATGRVLRGQEDERLRIAQELHDQVGQELTAVLLGLSRATGSADGPLREQLADVQEAVRSTLEDVRRIAIELRPEALDDLGLLSALAVLCDRFTQRTGVAVTQQVEELLPPLDAQTELVVYRVAQEALTNVARHSGSTEAALTLTTADARVTLTVSDSGRGLGSDPQPGSGTRGMRERAALIGGTLTVRSGPDGVGCRVSLTVSATDSIPSAEVPVGA